MCIKSPCQCERLFLPRIVLHQGSGQAASCLEGLVRYAHRAAQMPQAAQFDTMASFIAWSWAQPVKLDVGEGPVESGCSPAQRSRAWPTDGMNCWEATALFLAAAIAHEAPIEIHIYDAYVRGQRHVFPGIRQIGSSAQPEAVVLQHPLQNSYRAQAWYNDLLGGVHLVGDKVLRIFGQGDLADQMADWEGDALPDWGRTEGQKARRAKAKAQQEASQAEQEAGQAQKEAGQAQKARAQQQKERVSQLRAEIERLQAQLREIDAA
jgi:hypothetical protein